MKALIAEAWARARAAAPEVDNASRVFVGCPALWTGTERRLLADVVNELGIEVDVADIIDEPVAAGLHSVHSRVRSGQLSLSGRTVVFDAGGGTLDVAFLDVTQNEANEFTVLSAEGVALSGDEVDRRIARFLEPGVRAVADQALASLMLARQARELKEGLSRDTWRSTTLGAGYDIVLEMTRPELESVIEELLDQFMALTRSVVRGSLLRVAQVESPDSIRAFDWGKLTADVRHVVLVGGLSQMPVIAHRLTHLFPSAAVALVDAPQQSVALGLAMGEELNRLNLPRPPVDFVVEFGPPEVVSNRGLEQWAHENRRVYSAFSPLYHWADLMLGRSHLGYTFEVPYPHGLNGELECIFRAQLPDRAATPLNFVVNVSDEGESHTATGIAISHQAHRPARFTLYTNGDLLISGSRGESYRLRIERWPTLHGPNPDYRRKIELRTRSMGPYRSQLRFDDWRFN